MSNEQLTLFDDLNDPRLKPKTLWRVGRTVGRTVYVQRTDVPSKADVLVGLMDTPGLARQVCDAVNYCLEHGIDPSTFGGDAGVAPSELAPNVYDFFDWMSQCKDCGQAHQQTYYQDTKAVTWATLDCPLYRPRVALENLKTIKREFSAWLHRDT